ncbi:hypothetical protein FHETE_4273 [Fusarium heterosporum]|uniref:Zn(2)-C6 fungal-type domain-containing protein n=1 Tax=Fusarium heterosporum TaxID=42747 RepID=A0A8H5TMA3_FUSHE|nr:hypothetical protein FHETE_4273 [Fusarium heterosporum]
MWNLLDSHEARCVNTFLGPARTGELSSLADILEFKIITSLMLQVNRAELQSRDQILHPDHSQTPLESADCSIGHSPTDRSQGPSLYDTTHKTPYSIDKETDIDISINPRSPSYQNTNTKTRQTATDHEYCATLGSIHPRVRTSYPKKPAITTEYVKYVQQDIVETSQAQFLSSQTSSQAPRRIRKRGQGRRISSDSCQKCRKDRKKCIRWAKGPCERCHNAGAECLAGKLDGRTKAARIAKRKSQWDDGD